MDDRALERYSRQLLVPGFELEGQDALSAASVLIVGCGGLGAPVALYLAGAGVGRLRLVDDDVIELSNLPRQVAYTEADVGRPKVDVLADRLYAMNGTIQVEAVNARFDDAIADHCLSNIDVVVDASDNRDTRCVIDRCTAQGQQPWVMGAAVQMSGQNLIFSATRNEGCYHCLSPENDAGNSGSCRDLGILGPVVGAVALTQALDVIKILSGVGSVPWGVLRVHDFRTDEGYRLNIARRANCPVCSASN